MGRKNYQERKEARINRYEELARKNDRQASEDFEYNKRMAGVLQAEPIKVGHHSERRHRRDLERMDNRMSRGVKAMEKAEYYRKRVEAAESNAAISSDNPDATELLREELSEAEKRHAEKKRLNREFKKLKGDVEEFAKVETSFPDLIKEGLRTIEVVPYHGRPFPFLNNSNANIKRMKQRIRQLETLDAAEFKSETIGDITIEHDPEDNRTRVIFPNKPSSEVRTRLKRSGFRYSRKNNAWQRHYSKTALELARHIASSVSNEEVNV